MNSYVVHRVVTVTEDVESPSVSTSGTRRVQVPVRTTRPPDGADSGSRGSEEERSKRDVESKDGGKTKVVSEGPS